MQLKRAEGLAWRKLGNETIVINLKQRMMYGLNAEAGKLWEALDSGLDLEGDRGPGDASVGAFIQELLREGLAAGELRSSQGAPSSDSGPRVMWKEEVQQFAGGCGFHAGQGEPCDSTATNS